MDICVPIFLRKSYKVIASLLAITLFFVIYNSYLVDHSLINLRIALNSAAQAQTVDDFKKIQPLLKIPILKEIAKKNLFSEPYLSLETASSIIDNAKSDDQKQDIVFYLNSALQKKEAKRNKFLLFLDKVNAAIFGPKRAADALRLSPRIKDLLVKISRTSDNLTRQSLSYDLGNLYLETGDFKEAKEAFESAVNFAPSSILAWKAKFNLARTYVYLINYDTALELFNDVGNNNLDLRLAVTSQYEAADVLYRLGRYAEARDKYAELAHNNPQFELAALALQRAGNISMYELKDFKAALRFFYELGLLRAGSVSYFDMNDIDSALKYFSQIEENLPRSNAAVKHVKKNIRNIIARDFREEGFKFISEKQYSEAIISFKKALNIDPVDSLSLSGEALSRYWLGLKDEAFEKAKEAASLGEDSELTIVNVIFICLNTGNVDKAVAIGEKFMNSKIVSISRPEFYYNLGYAYVHAGKIDEAVTCLNRAIRMDEDFVFSYNNLGCAFWSKKDYAQAMRMFQKAVSLYPSYADAYFNLGVVYFQLGKLEDAYKEFQLALDAKPNFKDAGKFMNKIEAALNYKPSDLSIEPIEEPQSPQEKIQ